jgi:hypothetical protein
MKRIHSLSTLIRTDKEFPLICHMTIRLKFLNWNPGLRTQPLSTTQRIGASAKPHRSGIAK